jgi:polar amino acid transport system substrate-binding protein
MAHLLRLPALTLMLCASLCTLLTASPRAGAATDGLEEARKRGNLVVAIDHVVPEYKAGTKFRTPETIDSALAEELAKSMKLRLSMVGTQGATRPALPRADVVLTTLANPAAVPTGHVAIPVGYGAGPMAIMRSDTTIKSWEQLKGRTVCVSEGGHHVGSLASRYGAIEKIQRAPADALIAVRTGACDATVHDNAMLEEMLRLPEWKKFSARLPAGTPAQLVFIVPASDRKTITFLKQTADDWTARRVPEALMKKAVRSIAFEVYLDQDVPDCH